jgi:proteasome lid subunit RPN8/RPN11
MNSSALSVPTRIVESTVTSLRKAGDRQSEGVVLWLACGTPNGRLVTEAYVPEQEASHDFFRIPPESMAALLAHLGQTGSLIAAQVHSHPEEAFHSEADDRWAIVRHVGALSIVVPYFAKQISVGNFLGQVAMFRLNDANQWSELGRGDRERSVQIA